MDAPKVTGDGTLDESGEIRTDVACQRCGYNLRGLNAAGRCPECGTPVALSLRGDWLCYADPSYVGRLARGTRFVLDGLAVLLILPALAGAITGIAAAVSSLSKAQSRVSGTLMVCFGLPGALLGVAVFVYGIWLVTNPQAQVSGTARQDTARRLVRVYLLVFVIGLGLRFSVEALSPPLAILATFEFFSVGVSVLGVVGIVAYFLHLRGLALRISPESRWTGLDIPQAAKFLAQTLGITLGWLALVKAVETALVYVPLLLTPSGATRGPVGAGLPGAVSCISGIDGLVIFLLFLYATRVHYRLRDSLTREAARAAELWGKSPSDVVA